MATTFAILGLIAAYTGSLFGSVMNSPWVIGCIVIMLIYVAGSMIGFYDMYIPRFLQKSSSSPRGGSLLGAFAFGIASGTVASPCLSPGLLLLISIIAREGNMFAGFLMLFAFGIGLATPLWLIGTFSSTLALLPRAGTWMVEIKKLLGYVILLMCLYFLKPFVPHYLLWWFAAIIVGFILIRYIRDSKQKMRYTHLVGSCILGIIFAKCILETVQQHAPVEHIFWHHEFNEAQQLAIAQHKKILLDVTAPYCTICSAIEKKFFTDPNMQKLCAQHYIPVKIDASDETHPMHAPLRRSLHIVGVPTLIILEPATLTEVRRWGAELYDYDHDRFVQELL
jgi:thiol:disulfide interchange protein DsbD